MAGLKGLRGGREIGSGGNEKGNEEEEGRDGKSLEHMSHHLICEQITPSLAMKFLWWSGLVPVVAYEISLQLGSKACGQEARVNALQRGS